jgi:Bromodomain
MSENQVQPVQSTSLNQAQSPEEQEMDENNNKQTTGSSESQSVKPRGTLSEGKGKRIASKGKRGKVLGVKARQEKDEEGTKKRRTSATPTPKERAQKKGKLATKQAAMVQRATDLSSQKESQNESQNNDVSKSSAENADDENEPVVSSRTKNEIQKHLDSLDKKDLLSNRLITQKCMPVLQELLDDQFGWVFREAVDPVALCLPDYYDVVKSPMHLELVKKKLENAVYSDIEAFSHDTKLVFENAILYNGESSEVGELAQCMLKSFEKSFKSLVQDNTKKPDSEEGPTPVPNDESSS